MNLNDCRKFLCTELDKPIQTRKDYRQWALRNHPDKGGDPEEMKKNGDITDCMERLDEDPVDCKKFKNYKGPGPSKGPKTPSKTSSKGPSNSSGKVKVDMKKANYVRMIENWSHIQKYQRFDKGSFNAEKVKEEIASVSPKLDTLLKNIDALDAKDMKQYGHKFKHFIFSDVKRMGYGAKIIASGLVANGFTHCFSKEKSKLKIVPPASNDENKTFALLSSVALFDKKMPMKSVKEMLRMYNERPENIHGENVRFIILDSGFKEGIDLFDVKYVHIFENPRAKADERQTIGRATRNCGQKGLHFEPNVGWKLHVYQYLSSMSEENPDDLLFNKYIDYAGIDIKELIFKDNIERLVMESAVDADLNYEINKGYTKSDEKLEELLGLPTYSSSEASKTQSGGAKDLGCDGQFNKAKCGGRSTHATPFTLTQMKAIYESFDKKLSDSFLKQAARDKRAFFCKFMLENEAYCKRLNAFYRGEYTLPAKVKKNYTAKELENKLVVKDFETEKSESAKSDSAKSESAKSDSAKSDSAKSESAKSESVKSSLSSLKSEFDSVSKESYKSRESFKEFQERINRLFKKYKYGRIKLENQCIDDKEKDANAKAKDDRLITFTKSQDFVSNYFQHTMTPRNPNKGLLVWHSVGTGKTCTALATKSYTYDKKDWRILWVTRGTLREDIWKNMFDKVCDYGIRERIELGEHIPRNPKNLRKYVAQRFLRPMSYRQFSNLLKKIGPRYPEMVKLNGEKDILNRTLIIIDEAHKLFDAKEITGAEKPDIEAIQNGIWKSYDISGVNSCRLMLMSGTPINESPMEMVKLLNLLMEKKEHFELGSFEKDYLNEENAFTDIGREMFQNKIKGLVSYLNRSGDPRQFAIPEFHKVVVPISRMDVSDIELENCEEIYQEIYNECVANVSEPKSVSDCYAKFDADIAEEEANYADLEKEVKENPGKKMFVKRLESSRKKIQKLRENRTKKCKQEEEKRNKNHAKKMQKCTVSAEKASKACNTRNSKKQKNVIKDAHLKYQDAALKRQKIPV